MNSINPTTPIKRGRGRPKGSKNKLTANKAGRKTKFTPEVKAVIIKGYENGVPRHSILQVARVHGSTFEDWIKQGKADLADGKETDFSKFHQEVERAKGVMQYKVHQTIMNSSLGGIIKKPELALKLLLMLKPNDYETEQKVKVDSKVEHSGSIDLRSMTDEDLAQEIEKFKASVDNEQDSV